MFFFNKALVIALSATIFAYNFVMREARSIGFADLAISENSTFLAVLIKFKDFI